MVCLYVEPWRYFSRVHENQSRGRKSQALWGKGRVKEKKKLRSIEILLSEKLQLNLFLWNFLPIQTDTLSFVMYTLPLILVSSHKILKHMFVITGY